MHSGDHGLSLIVALNALMLAFVLGLSGTSCSAAQPADSVQHFYAKYLKVHTSGGLPTEPELMILRPFLSKRLYALLGDALRYQANWAKSHPDEPAVSGAPPVIYKPPFIDGEYFAGNFEGIKRFAIAETKPLNGGRWQVFLHFWYEPESKGWEDSVVVLQEDGNYVIDDIVCGGHGQFNPPGRLSELLRSRSQE